MNAFFTNASLRPQSRAQPARVAVVGGGLGGLAAAGHLGASGHLVTLFEQAPTLGGKAARFVGGGVTRSGAWAAGLAQAWVKGARR